MGFVLHGWARAGLPFMMSAFFNPYMTSLARFAAAKDSPLLYARWLGVSMLATSYASVYTTVVAVISAILAPYVGAACDSTPYRRNYVVWTTNLSAMFTVLCIFVNSDTWYLAGILGGLALILYELSLTFVYAYLPEVGNSNVERNKVSSFTVLGTNMCQLVLMAFIAGLLYVLDPSDLVLKNASFESGVAYWSLDPSSTASSNTISSSSLQTCNDSYCSVLSNNAYAGSFSLLLNSSGTSSIGIYQNSTNQVADLKRRSGLLLGYLSCSPSDNCGLRIYDNLEATSFWNHDSSSSGGYSLYAAVFSTSSSTTEVGYEVFVPGNSATYVDNLSLYSKPSSNIPFSMLVTGLWFFIFGLMCFTHLGERKNNRGNDLKMSQFIIMVNKNLAVSIRDVFKTPRLILWFMAFALYTGGATGVVALAGTYLQDQLGLSASVSGVVLLYSQFIGIGGAFIAYTGGKKIGFELATLLSYGLWFGAIFLAFFMWTDSTTPFASVIFISTLFGISAGCTLALNRASLAGMIPEGKEAEYMGLFNLFSKILSWTGTVMFTAVNEARGSFRLAFLSMSSLFAIAAIFQVGVLFSPIPKTTRQAAELGPTSPPRPSALAESPPESPKTRAKSTKTAINELDDSL